MSNNRKILVVDPTFLIRAVDYLKSIPGMRLERAVAGWRAASTIKGAE